MLELRKGDDILTAVGGITTIEAARELFAAQLDEKAKAKLSQIKNEEALIKVVKNKITALEYIYEIHKKKYSTKSSNEVQEFVESFKKYLVNASEIEKEFFSNKISLAISLASVKKLRSLVKSAAISSNHDIICLSENKFPLIVK